MKGGMGGDVVFKVDWGGDVVLKVDWVVTSNLRRFLEVTLI